MKRIISSSLMLAIILVISNCSQYTMLAAGRLSIKQRIELVKSNSARLNDSTATDPGEYMSDQTYQSIKNDVLAIITQYITENNEEFKKANRGLNALTVTGTVVGLGGGVYGLLDPGENAKAASVTSLTAGALTAIVSQLNYHKRKNRAQQCLGKLEVLRISVTRWNLLKKPTNATEAATFQTAIDEIFDQLVEDKCFGKIEISN